MISVEELRTVLDAFPPGTMLEVRIMAVDTVATGGRALSNAEKCRAYRNRKRNTAQVSGSVESTPSDTETVSGQRISSSDSSSGSVSEKEQKEPEKSGITQTYQVSGEPAQMALATLAPTPRDTSVVQVFTCWRDLYSPRSRLDTKRRRRIEARLREGFSVDDLCAALRNAKNSPFHMGQNDTGTVYSGIETLLRDAAQVERLRDLTEPLRPRSAPVRNSGSEMTERAHRIAAEERAAAAKNGARPALALLSEFPR